MSSEILLSRLTTFIETIKVFPDFRYLGDPVLHTPTSEVSVQEGIVIGDKLGQILVAYRQLVGFGRGLSANQIGIPKSVFVTFLDDQIQIYINPKIIKLSDQQNLYRELCLSSGIIWGDIKRSVTITMQWKDKEGMDHQEEITGPKARIFQHEYEHLKGDHSINHAEPGSIEICLSDPLKEVFREV